ncbi:ABC transporter permease [Ekhidna sp.]|uniref:ABC transporter permease n=1 Tax=Ekhidna sp. TaxID=2608089 RepID=UPI00351255A9
MNFSLENAIQNWRKKLHSQKGLEPGDIAELEDHLRSNIEDLIKSGNTEESAFNQIIERDWNNLKIVSKEFLNMREPKSIIPTSLLKNFLKVSFRSMRKRWQYSAINLFGLIIGLSSVFGISIYVMQEMTYDRFHENGENIYRVVNIFKRSSGDFKYPSAPPALAPTIGTSLPGIERVTRLRTSDEILLKYGDKQFYESGGFYADSSFLQMFSFELEKGDAKKALSEPNSIVLTKDLATKYFGGENPMGKVLTFDDNRPLKVTGLLKQVPVNSHINFDFLISFPTYVVPEGYLADLNSWSWLGFPTYFQLSDNANLDDLEASLLEAYTGLNTSAANRETKIMLQPLFDIYLGSGEFGNPHGGIFATNSINTTMSLMGVAILILFVASFNYLNITTASFQTRFKEMGIRQVMGSGKGKITWQLITESSIMVCISGLIGLGVAYGLLTMGVSRLNLASAITIEVIAYMILGLLALSTILGLVVGLLAGGSLIDSKMLELLKGTKTPASGNNLFRYSMLFVQYVIAAGLIMVSIVVGRQINFMNEKELGYDREGILVLSGLPDQITNNYRRFKNLVSSNPDITNVTISSHAFEGGASGSPMRISTWPNDQTHQTAYYQVDHEFLETMGIELLQGRTFSPNIPSDSTQAVILNESAARAMEINELSGQKVLFTTSTEMEVIGIIKDFHHQSLHHQVGPMALVMPFANPSYILVRFKTQDLSSLIAFAEDSWNEATGGSAGPLTARFLDDVLNQQYQKDQYFGQLIQLFTILAILIACLGLWGLTSIAINMKIKSVCIRKVLGAKPIDILLNIGKVFLWTALIGTIVSWPLVQWASGKWLENFAYHIQTDFTILIFALILVALISGLTLYAQFFKIERTNPSSILQNDD